MVARPCSSYVHNTGGEATSLIPQHLLNLSKNYQFAGENRTPHPGDVWVALVMVLNVDISKYFLCDFNNTFPLFTAQFINHCLTSELLMCRWHPRVALCKQLDWSQALSGLHSG